MHKAVNRGAPWGLPIYGVWSPPIHPVGAFVGPAYLRSLVAPPHIRSVPSWGLPIYGVWSPPPHIRSVPSWGLPIYGVWSPPPPHPVGAFVGPAYLRSLVAPPPHPVGAFVPAAACCWPRARTAAGDAAFPSAAAVLWNNLPLVLRQIEDAISFKTAWKTYLFRCAVIKRCSSDLGVTVNLL